MKKETSPDNTQDQAQAKILARNQQLICANVLRVIAKLHLIKMIDNNTIEHEKDKFNELLHNQQLRTLKEENNDFVLNSEMA